MEWAEIVREHGPPTYRTAWRILQQAQDCEDVVQDVFAEAHRVHMRTPITHWRTFLDRLATFRALDALRRRKKNGAMRRRLTESVSADPENDLMLQELRERLRVAIAELPERQAAVLCLSHFEQRTNLDIAEILGITPNAVGLALHKARTTLRQLLTDSKGDVTHE